MTLDELVGRLQELQAEGHGARRVYLEDESYALEVSGAACVRLGDFGAGLERFIDGEIQPPRGMTVDQCEQVVRVKVG